MNARWLFAWVPFIAACGAAKPATSAAPRPQVSAQAAPEPPPAASCDGGTRPTSGSDGLVARVDVRGLSTIPRERVCRLLTTVAGTPARREVIAHDIHELWQTGSFDDVSVSSEPSPTGLEVTFQVRERPHVASWAIRGVAAGDPAGVHMLFGRLGEVFDPAAMHTKVAALREEYVQQGYRHADVSWKVDRTKTGDVDVTLEVAQGPKVRIGAIRFTGVSKAREEQLVALIETNRGVWNKVGAIFRADSFDRDLLVIAADYYDRGHIEIDVSMPELTPSADKSSLAITVDVTEGPIFKLAKVRCQGDLAGGERGCLDLLGVKSGEVFSRATLLKGIERVREIQHKSGHGEQIDPKTHIDAAKRAVDLTLEISRLTRSAARLRRSARSPGRGSLR